MPRVQAPRRPTSRDPLVAAPLAGLIPTQGAGGSRETLRARTNRRIDIALLPLLSLLYLFNGLDRSNIGNAQTQGFTDDIGCQPDDFNHAVSLFYLTFVLFQPISAGVGGWLGPKHWIPLMMFVWGTVTFSQAFIWGRGSLITTRLLIGAFEAGFYPTAVAYLALFYYPFDLGLRIGLFYGLYVVANAFSGAMAYAIFQIQILGVKSWQVLFLIQGSLTCLLAVIAWIWLPAGPESAWFLSPQQRNWVVERVQPGEITGKQPSGVTWRDVAETARDWKLWFVLVFNICASVPATAFSVFLPLVVEGMGYSSVEANLVSQLNLSRPSRLGLSLGYRWVALTQGMKMSVPPALCGAVGLYLFALSSDYHRERGCHILAAMVVALVGLVAVVTVSTNRAKYAALCLFLFGSYVPAPLTTAWLSENTPAPGKRLLVLGVNGWGNLAGVVGSQLYRAEYAPEYRTPFLATFGFVAAALAGYVAYRCALQAVNRRRAEIRRLMPATEIERRDTARYADRKSTFVYGL
ncbi:major facilitator superfamily transporter [Cercophora newfieldiana]|uniref:Major facilitator superfamily transporter n=1 Tax=Cercophora newfieldiana TaxID=92897 RepID=A0AA39XWD0_9PEZI|nr:major facilitator superfamily transporter [Cercophora newfieldiana]